MKRCFINLKARRICFSKWSNKSYGIFASLKALVKIGTVSASYSLLAVPMATFAQTDTLTVSKNVDIDEVVLSKPSAASTYSELMRAVVVITSDEFSGLPVTTLQELLEQVASVDIRQRGGHGVQADLMVRGGSFDQVLVLLNGVNITDPQTGHHNLNIPIDLESVDRIELLQGPGARVYGPGTFSGAINIITNPQTKSKASVAISAGDHGLIKTSASAGVSASKAKVFIAASSAKSDGYASNTDFNIYNLFTHACYDTKSGSINFQAGYQDKAFGAQSFYTPKFPDQFEKTGTLFSSLSYSHEVKGITINPTVYYRTHTDRFELFRRQAPEWYTGHNYHATQVAGGKVQLTRFSSAIGRTRAGFEIRHESILSNKLGSPLSQHVPIAAHPNLYYTHGTGRLLSNAFIDHTLYLNRVTISAGGLFSSSSNFGKNWNYGVDMSIKLLQGFSLFVSASNAIRFPTFTDLYYEGPTNYGNSNLNPEKTNSYESGLKIIGNRVNATATVFRRMGTDVIDWVRKPEETRFTTMNHTSINTNGVEGNISLNAKGLLPLLQSISGSFMYLNSNKSSGAIVSYYALDYLRMKTIVTINHKVVKNISAAWSIGHHSRMGTYTEYPSGIEKPYNDYRLTNLRVTWKKNSYSAFIDILNLLDVKYFDLGNIEQPGQWISIGIKYSNL